MSSKKQLHILFLSSWFPSRVFKTHGNFVHKHAQAIALEHKVTVVFPVGDASKTTTSLEIEENNDRNLKCIIVYFKKHSNTFINASRKYRALLKGLHLAENNFDIIHANVLFPIGIFALRLKSKYNIPLICTEHWTGYMPEDPNEISFLQKKLLQRIVKNSHTIVPVSKTLVTAMQAIGLKGNYKVVGNAVDTTLFIPKEKENSIFKILHVSYLNNDQKNIEGLLKGIEFLAKKRTDFHIDIIGDGPHEKTIEVLNLMAIPKQCYTLHSAKNPEEIAVFMQKANVYVSFSNYESFGVVLIEALATKTPVISTNTGVLAETNDTDICKVIKIKDSLSLAKNLELLIENKLQFNTIKMRNYAVNNFSFQTICDRFTNIYLEALK